MEEKVAELRTMLRDIADLQRAEATLAWDQATYMPNGGAVSRGRQRATLSRLAHEKSIDPILGKLLDSLEANATSLPYESNEGSLFRVARRDFERALKVPSEYIARATASAAQSYEAWKRARPANDFASMLPFLENTIDLGRGRARIESKKQTGLPE
jgi:carboxypeptidase Taq